MSLLEDDVSYEYRIDFNGYFYRDGIRDENQILMQYTGLKDKNGKEIYEGDIVEYQYLNTLKQEIRRSEVALMSLGDGINKNVQSYYPFCYPISGCYKERNREVVECYITPSSDCEIIGNVYENPELMVK